MAETTFTPARSCTLYYCLITILIQLTMNCCYAGPADAVQKPGSHHFERPVFNFMVPAAGAVRNSERLFFLSAVPGDSIKQSYTLDSQGGIIGMPDGNVYLIFSAHDRAEGGAFINEVLKRQQVKAGFFFTGDFLRSKRFSPLVKQLKREGHYIGSHSDKHLLYNDWVKRDSTLVTKDSFMRDLQRSLKTLRQRGIKPGKWFLPPYEWYNRETVRWAAEAGLTTINFTPGIVTNADYTWPELKNYRSSVEIFDQLKKYETEKGLGGKIILIHYGTDERRTDKFYYQLETIIKWIVSKGYTFGSFL